MEERHFEKGERRFLFKIFCKKYKEKYYWCFDCVIYIAYIQGNICSIYLRLYKSALEFEYLQLYKDRVDIFVTKKN